MQKGYQHLLKQVTTPKTTPNTTPNTTPKATENQDLILNPEKLRERVKNRIDELKDLYIYSNNDSAVPLSGQFFCYNFMYIDSYMEGERFIEQWWIVMIPL